MSEHTVQYLHWNDLDSQIGWQKLFLVDMSAGWAKWQWCQNTGSSSVFPLYSSVSTCKTEELILFVHMIVSSYLLCKTEELTLCVHIMLWIPFLRSLIYSCCKATNTGAWESQSQHLKNEIWPMYQTGSWGALCRNRDSITCTHTVFENHDMFHPNRFISVPRISTRKLQSFLFPS